MRHHIRASTVGLGCLLAAACAEGPQDPEPVPDRPVPATLRVVSGDAQIGEPGAALASPITIAVLDQYGAPFSNAPVRFAVHAGGGTLERTLVASAPDGLASTSWSLGTDLGVSPQSVDVWVVRDGAPSARFVAFARFTAGALTVAAGDSQSSMVGASVPVGPSVAVRTAGVPARPVAGVLVRWEVIEGGGVIASASSPTGVDGMASMKWTLGPTAGVGNQRLRAWVDGLAAVPIEFVASAVQPPSVLLAASPDSQSGPAGGGWTRPPEVIALGPSGHPVPGVTIHWRHAAGGGTLESDMSTTDAQGRARMWGTVGHVAGSTETAEASTPWVSGPPVVFNLTVGPADANNLARVAGDGQAGPIGTPLPLPLGAKVTDVYGNAVPGVLVEWSTASGGEVTPAYSTTDATGVAWTSWRLGPSLGAQAAEASVAYGPFGFGVTFSAHATAGP